MSIVKEISAIISIMVNESTSVLRAIVGIGAITPLIEQITNNDIDIQINVSNFLTVRIIEFAYNILLFSRNKTFYL